MHENLMNDNFWCVCVYIYIYVYILVYMCLYECLNTGIYECMNDLE
jgi:hypothetical protein